MQHTKKFLQFVYSLVRLPDGDDNKSLNQESSQRLTAETFSLLTVISSSGNP